MKIAAGIVLYNPDMKRLKKNVNAIISQVDRVFIINNGEKIKDVDLKGEYGFLKDKKISITNNEKNVGIAKALNQIVEKCISKKYTWVLLLDQDSVAEDKMIEKLAAETNRKNVSIAAPRIIDLNKDQNHNSDEKVEDVNMVITSGSLINVEDCKKLGMFDESMFIDFVDFDYCKRVKLAGKRIIRVNSASMKHEVGKRTKRKLLWMTVYPTNHSPERVYYYVRNIIYFNRKFRGLLSFKEWLRLKASLIWKWVSIYVYETDRKDKKKMYRLGKKDGARISLPELTEGAIK